MITPAYIVPVLLALVFAATATPHSEPYPYKDWIQKGENCAPPVTITKTSTAISTVTATATTTTTATIATSTSITIDQCNTGSIQCCNSVTHVSCARLDK